MSYFNDFVSATNSALVEAQATADGQTLTMEEGISRFIDIAQKVKKAGNTLYFMGNGASASMAAHFSADVTKNGEIKAQCFHESSLMTAISNDIDYKNIFALPIQRYAEPGDVIITISSSGNSPNIIEGIKAAKEKGLTVVTLSGKATDNQSRQLGDLNFYIPAQSYGLVESSHAVLLHAWLDQMLNEEIH